VPDIQMTPAEAGWYFVRVWDKEGHVNGLQRFPVGAWAVRAEEGRLVVPLLAKPGAVGLTVPDADDRLAAVGLCPPDREWLTYFPAEAVRKATERWLTARSTAGESARARVAAAEKALAEVELPGHGKIPVRDASPPRPTQSWLDKAWGGSGQPRLPGDAG
jgi:hypothetical protein